MAITGIVIRSVSPIPRILGHEYITPKGGIYIYTASKSPCGFFLADVRRL